jgi:adenosylmethionine-8-amino-7-oxononanoate aminotransferase
MGYPMNSTELDIQDLEAKAKRHLWMHFSRHGNYKNSEIPIIVRGKGCDLWDARGKKYMDGLSGLFTTQLGHGRPDLAAAAAKQAETLEFFPIWNYAHPPAIELAAKLADLAPGDLNRVFFTSGGSESVESAWKLARQYFKTIGQPGRIKVISRETAYHGTTLGALAITGVAGLRTPFEPLAPGAFHVVNTDHYRQGEHLDDDAFSTWCAADIERTILMEGADTIAAVYLEPVQNSGGCFVPPPGYFQKVREICDRYGVLLVSDEVICAFGRLGYMFGCERYDYLPDMITMAKGLTSGYSPLGGVIVRDFLAEPFMSGNASFAHGLTFGGHPVSCAVALANLEAFENENVLEHVQKNEGVFRDYVEALRDIPIVGDVRGAGYFLALELVRDQATKGSFTHEEAEDMLRGFLSPRLYEAGLICRADDRGEPVVQLSPPLIAGETEFEFITSTLRTVLTEAAARVGL